MRFNRKIKGMIEAILVIIAFIAFSYVVQNNLDFFENFMSNNILGISIYIFIEIISIVVAPVTTLPIIAVASNLWGWIFAGVISIFAWLIGAWIAFFIGRKYGIGIIKKFIPLNKLNALEKRIPEEHLFWSVVLFRFIIPVDLFSYALGIFTKMKTKDYLMATLLGITPFAFVFAYLGTVPFEYQTLMFLIAGIVILLGWIIRKVYCKNKSKKVIKT